MFVEILVRFIGKQYPIGDRPNQPKQFRFPDRKFGSSKVVSRKFMKDWFDKFPWLHYDELNDRAFRHTCIAAYIKGYMSTVIDTIEPKEKSFCIT